MQRAVALRSGTRFLSHAISRANGRKGEPEARRQEDLPAPVEMRLQEFGDRSRLRRCPRRGRRRHTRPGARYELRLTRQGQHDDESETHGERPEVTAPPTHQSKLIRCTGGAGFSLPTPACGRIHSTIFSIRTIGSASP
jgi:hypothetical protein